MSYVPYRPPGGPLEFALPDDTERLLALPYRAHRWQGTGRYDSELAFGKSYPSKYDAERWPELVRGAEERMLTYQRLLFPHGRVYVEADCTVAFVLDQWSHIHYHAVVNGTELSSYVERSAALMGRMKRLGIADQACLAAGKIRGGGTMPDGRPRDYFVAIDMKRFPGRSNW